MFDITLILLTANLSPAVITLTEHLDDPWENHILKKWKLKVLFSWSVFEAAVDVGYRQQSNQYCKSKNHGARCQEYIEMICLMKIRRVSRGSFTPSFSQNGT
jgi:hypothetical protein